MSELLKDYTFQVVALGVTTLGALSGILGVFAVLRKQSLMGDGISHAALPGIAAVFLLTGIKDAGALIIGALLFGIAAALLIQSITEYSRIKFDTALALIMSTFFGFGLVLLTCIQKMPNSEQAGLSRFIFGQASTLLPKDVRLIVACSIVMLLPVVLFWKEFKIISFDSDFAAVIGIAPGPVGLGLSLMIVFSIVIALQAVGVVLMSALLIAPAVAARQWTDRLGAMVPLSAVFGATAGFFGTMVSSLIARVPTGPAIVMIASAFVMISLLLSPRRGIAAKMIKRKALQKKISMIKNEGAEHESSN